MNITYNNRTISISEPSAPTLADVLAAQNVPDKGIAAAVNNKLVPRRQWGETPMKEGDNVVVIKAVCGG